MNFNCTVKDLSCYENKFLRYYARDTACKVRVLQVLWVKVTITKHAHNGCPLDLFKVFVYLKHTQTHHIKPTLSSKNLGL